MRRPHRGFWLIISLALSAAATLVTMLAAPPVLAVIGPCTPGFSPAAGTPARVGEFPVWAVGGSFNGDGATDVAVANYSSGTVSVLLGNGSGGLSEAPGSPIALGGRPQSLAVGRFNGDGFDDLAVAHESQSTVSILLGIGNGSFAHAVGSPFSVPTGARAVAVGKFNGDGLDDLVVGGGPVTILLGNGSGGFAPAPSPPILAGDFARTIAVGSLNGDPHADLVVSSANSATLDIVTILLGDGAGGFVRAPDSPISKGGNPSAIVVGDANGDGTNDLAVTQMNFGQVSIMLGDGNGRFADAPGSPIQNQPGATSPVAARFGGDALVDVAVASMFANDVAVFQGTSGGGLTPAPDSPIAIGDRPSALVLGAFNGDSQPDIAVVRQGSQDVTILLGACRSADLGITATDSPDPVARGEELAYTVTAQNHGPDPASAVTISQQLPPNVTFVSLVAPGTWTCATPAVGASGVVTCTVGQVPVGSTTFTLRARVGTGAQAPGAVQSTASISAATGDPSGANNSASAETTVVASAACIPRPPIRAAVARADTNRLQVTISASTPPGTAGYRLIRIVATVPPNARIDILGGPSNLSGRQSLGVGTGAQPVTFTIRRVESGPVTIPLEIEDTCGTWRTFVGGGTGAF